MSDPENPTTNKRLVHEIVQLTQKIVNLTTERESLQRERNYYQLRFLEKQQKRLQLERELFERVCSHVYDNDPEKEMECSAATHGKKNAPLPGTMDRPSQTDPSG